MLIYFSNVQLIHDCSENESQAGRCSSSTLRENGSGEYDDERYRSCFKKGRRTLYTYFKSKEDIYMAVAESELDILSDTMKRVVEKNISPDRKIIEMIYTRLDAVKEVVFVMARFVLTSFVIFGE